MTTVLARHIRLSQQALSLALALLVTAGSLGAVRGLAAADQANLSANRAAQAPQAIAAMLVVRRS